MDRIADTSNPFALWASTVNIDRGDASHASAGLLMIIREQAEKAQRREDYEAMEYIRVKGREAKDMLDQRIRELAMREAGGELTEAK